MSLRRTAWSLSLLTLVLAFTACPAAKAQDQDAPVKRGRKYKSPPATSHIEVTVTKKFNGKPIMNAAVIFNPVKDGKDEGNLEVKTDPDGKAIIDVIPTGSTVRVQVIAQGFATFAEEYEVMDPSKEISISMIHPREQVSSYVDNDGKATTRKPGVQEPIRTTTPAAKPTPTTPPATQPQPTPAPDSTPQP
ncbi:carboxypeptidase-like regulatory domain-containing protein [Granulicella sp. S190]|uniref:carboxypeptidase-like regulatory domain-containing protein n=1 Tax=Granulicella sp. S190 TaxID=1747226 RepID=UPI00131BC9F2|nr:carboxypeptidase-like regulatory domain-containing protein [Granulicella sp. S190]